MTIFCININNVAYAKYSLPLIEKLCKYNNVKLYVLDRNIPQNINNVHPSWLKLFCHSLVDDDFIVCWDLDLVPIKPYILHDFFDYSKLNLSYDGCYLADNFVFNGKFKYNCGLFGIPKTYQTFIEDIYKEKSFKSTYPSFEQYYVNDVIFDNNIDINIIDTKLNFLYNGSDLDSTINNFNIHYTWKISSNEHRNILIQKHYNKYCNNFNSI